MRQQAAKNTNTAELCVTIFEGCYFFLLLKTKLAPIRLKSTKNVTEFNYSEICLYICAENIVIIVELCNEFLNFK